MLRSGDEAPAPEPPNGALAFDLRHEWELPESQLLCLLVPHGETVEVLVNTAHGMAGYLHASQHNERGLSGPRACVIGDACGYDDVGNADSPDMSGRG